MPSRLHSPRALQYTNPHPLLPPICRQPHKALWLGFEVLATESTQKARQASYKTQAAAVRAATRSLTSDMGARPGLGGSVNSGGARELAPRLQLLLDQGLHLRLPVHGRAVLVELRPHAPRSMDGQWRAETVLRVLCLHPMVVKQGSDLWGCLRGLCGPACGGALPTALPPLGRCAVLAGPPMM